MRKRVSKNKSQKCLKTRSPFLPICPWGPVRRLVIAAPAHPRWNPSAVVFYPFRPTTIRVAFSPACPMQPMQHQVIPKQDHFAGVAFVYSSGGFHSLYVVSYKGQKCYFLILTYARYVMTVGAGLCAHAYQIMLCVSAALVAGTIPNHAPTHFQRAE